MYKVHESEMIVLGLRMKKKEMERGNGKGRGETAGEGKGGRRTGWERRRKRMLLWLGMFGLNRTPFSCYVNNTGQEEVR